MAFGDEASKLREELLTVTFVTRAATFVISTTLMFHIRVIATNGEV